MVTVQISSEAHGKLLDIKERSKFHRDLPINELLDSVIGSYYERKLDEIDFRRYVAKNHTRLLSGQGWRCYYCGGGLSRKNSTVDHLLPRSRGGLSESGNLVATCKQCNHDKGDMTEEEYYKYLELSTST